MLPVVTILQIMNNSEVKHKLKTKIRMKINVPGYSICKMYEKHYNRDRYAQLSVFGSQHSDLLVQW